MRCWKIAVAVLPLLLVACAEPRPARSACPVEKRCLEYGNQDEPASLDPHRITGSAELRIVGDLFAGLTQPDAADAPIPGMATSWETSQDGLVWRFQLRDALWSDGVPVTADDFVFSLQRALDPAVASQFAPLLYFIVNAQAVNTAELPAAALGVRAIAKHTLEIALTHPVSYLLELAKHPIMMPVPRHVVMQWGDAWSQPAHLVSNGAYRIVSWRLGDRIQVRKNPVFWDAAQVCFDQINYYPTTDSISAERRVQRGELDLNADFQSNRAEYLRRKMPGYIRSSAYLSTTYLSFNLRYPPLRDRRVREALAMAVDNAFITSKLLRAGQTPAWSFVTPGTASYAGSARTYWAQWPFVQRQERARQLLAEAGYGPDRALTIEIKHRNQPDPILYLGAVQADWRAIGVEVTLAQNETQVAYAAYQVGDFQVADVGVTADFNDAASFLHLLNSDSGAQNYGDYRNAAFDDLLSAAAREADVARRAQLLSDAEQIMLDDVAIIPVYFSVSRALVNPSITGWQSNLGARHPARYLCKTGHP